MVLALLGEEEEGGEIEMSGVWRDGKYVLDSTLSERERVLTAGIMAVAHLIDASRGVTGLHLNGDDESWDKLRTGGRFEVWLLDFDKALKLAEAIK